MLAFLHTSTVHVPHFTRIAQELDASVALRHEVREDLLARAIADGRVTDETLADTQSAVRALVADGARVVVCTCSSLGSAAESTPGLSRAHVLRADRPMAELAVALGRPILVVATTPTAMVSAVALLHDAHVAPPALRELLCDAAWARFESGDRLGYAKEVAEQIDAHARPGDVVVLAQASMTPAAALVRRQGVEVLTSPELGVRAAVELLRG